MRAGFSHTAYTFAHESMVTKSIVDSNNVAPGTLVALIQKGMQYLELEANLDEQVCAGGVVQDAFLFVADGMAFRLLRMETWRATSRC